jgi:AmmeMemoRadiSam system protein B
MMRQPVVANSFYPGSPAALDSEVESLIEKAGRIAAKNCLAVVSPHAGYIYSGSLAAKTLSSVNIPETVVLLGPKHTGLGAAVALSSCDWQMVSGPVTNNREFGELFLRLCPELGVDELAHRDEHSLEVQLPFLQFLQNKLSIVPVVIGRVSFSLCQEIATALAGAIKEYQKDVLIVASSDMSHYESRSSSQKKDRKALDAIALMNPSMLYDTVSNNHISMCGVIPVVIALLSAQLLGAKSSELIGYTDSGYVSGDTRQVVGYAGIVIS